MNAKTAWIAAILVGLGAFGPSRAAASEQRLETALPRRTARLAASALRLKALRWELGIQDRGVRRHFAQLQAWVQKPGGKLPGTSRFSVGIENAGPNEVDGVVVRFALSAKVAPASGGTGVWIVPFELGESRVPRLRPGENRMVNLSPGHLSGFLHRLAVQGFWPEAFKVQVMLDPKAGDDLASDVKELVLPVVR